jgi:hypothetical protein
LLLPAGKPIMSLRDDAGSVALSASTDQAMNRVVSEMQRIYK